MKNKTEKSIQVKLSRLIAEMDGAGSVPSNEGPSRNRDEAARLVSIFLRWSLFGFFCLGVGFWFGRYNARILGSLNQSPKGVVSIEQDGWRADGTGVFYRWCRDSCHAPRLYGGGVIQVFEVYCSGRPCGDMAMSFNVLNAQGRVIDKILLREKGVQGELRRFMVETQNSDAASIELSDFQARAKV